MSQAAIALLLAASVLLVGCSPAPGAVPWTPAPPPIPAVSVDHRVDEFRAVVERLDAAMRESEPTVAFEPAAFDLQKADWHAAPYVATATLKGRRATGAKYPDVTWEFYYGWQDEKWTYSGGMLTQAYEQGRLRSNGEMKPGQPYGMAGRAAQKP